jgi:hypothetical protein
MGKEESTKSTRYATMVAEAEESVSAVKDPDLRRVAFEKILATLLEGRQLKSGEQKRSPRPTTAQTNKRSTGSLRRTRCWRRRSNWPQNWPRAPLSPTA